MGLPGKMIWKTMQHDVRHSHCPVSPQGKSMRVTFWR
eukprot:CAMPEP_0119430266 /NCGR_PEP_ID=MMETSP1335-20130426/43746_1 /TAXON_ID=259385 /ORGANISM="Chrysoculter rhomboideus, Strain RCC1486" /LENGTH=36 /DNA_ID= /DNA_START= /DNA_END= /DNA_ORIENTATION=